MTTQNRTWNVKPLSEKQVSFYYEVCARKNVLPRGLDGVTSAQLSKMIDETLKLPTRASEKQINMLREIITELVEAGVEGVKMPTQKYYDALTVDSASQQIEKAKAIRAKNFDKLKPSAQQLDELASWYGFVEVDWETYGIQTKIYAEQYNAWVMEETVVTVEEEKSLPWEIKRPQHIAISGRFIGESQWRYMTAEEFKAELEKKLTHSNASALLDKYRSAFRTFNNSRISPWQKDQIKKLEQRMANIFVPKEVTVYHLDQELGTEGEVMEEFGGFVDEGFDVEFNTFTDLDTPFAQDTKRSNQQWNPVAYVFTDDIQLDMMSKSEADKFIAQLRYELTLADLRKATGAQNLDYENAGIEETRTAKEVSDARNKEFKQFNDFLYGLSDVVGNHFEFDGFTVESLRHEVLNIFFDRGQRKDGADANGASGELKQALRNQIKDFMKFAVTNKSIKFDGLMGLADRTDMGGELIDELIADPVFAVELLRIQRAQF